MRNVVAIVMVLMLVQTNADGANFWLSTVGTVGGEVTIEAPELEVTGPGELYLWARPAQDETLVNIGLNVQTTTQGVIDLTSIAVVNPVMGGGPLTGDIVRYEFRKDTDAEPPFQVEPEVDPSRLEGFGGFTVTNELAIGIGIGPGSTGSDPLFDAAANAWLIGVLSYDVVGPVGSTTELFLQIGAMGITNQTAASVNVNVIFGDGSDPPLNADTNRGVNSATADATIIVIPEPSALLLAVLGLFGLVACHRWQRELRAP